MKEIANELGNIMLSRIVSIVALGLVYGVYSGYFKQMVEAFFAGICG